MSTPPAAATRTRPAAAATGRRPPGPRREFFFGNLRPFAADILGYLTFCVREFGDTVSLRLPGRDVLVLNRPEDIESVLLTQRSNFIKHSFFWRHVTAIFGNGLLTSEGDFWLRQRRLAAPAFHPDRIAAYGEVMTAYTDRLVEGWADGERRDVHKDMMRVTMEIVSKTLFDVEVEEDVDAIGRSFDMVIREIAKRFRRPVKIADWIPVPGNLRYRRGVALLDRLVARVLAERRARPGDRGDLLSMLMAARDDDGKPMSDRQLRDELITLFLAGHETTAIALSWTLFLLARHPEVEERLYREIGETLAGRLPKAADLPRLRFAEAVVRESLRLYPPAYVIGREALADCVIGDYDVAPGTTIYFAPWVLHRDPRHFPDPEAFRPERWLDGSTARLPKYAYIPFGGGPRICIGERFAMMEGVLVLVTLLRRFRLEMDGPDPVPFPSITLRPEGGPMMKVFSRRSSVAGSRGKTEN
ncbi:MAG TPA: cytochrome P450 [Thermoanaerobaculia bacterium]